MKTYVTGLGVISGIGKGVEENSWFLKAEHGMGNAPFLPTALDVPVSEVVKQSNEELKKPCPFHPARTYSRTALCQLLWAAQGAARVMRNSISLLPVSGSFLPLPSEEWMQASGFMPLSGKEESNFEKEITWHYLHDCGSSTEMIAAYLGVKGTVTTPHRLVLPLQMPLC